MTLILYFQTLSISLSPSVQLSNRSSPNKGRNTIYSKYTWESGYWLVVLPHRTFELYFNQGLTLLPFFQTRIVASSWFSVYGLSYFARALSLEFYVHILLLCYLSHLESKNLFLCVKTFYPCKQVDLECLVSAPVKCEMSLCFSFSSINEVMCNAQYILAWKYPHVTEGHSGICNVLIWIVTL